MVPVWFKAIPNMNTQHNSLYFVHFASRSPSVFTCFLPWFQVVHQADASINHCFPTFCIGYEHGSGWLRMVPACFRINPNMITKHKAHQHMHAIAPPPIVMTLPTTARTPKGSQILNLDGQKSGVSGLRRPLYSGRRN